MTSTVEKPPKSVGATPGFTLTHKQILTILSGLMMGMFLASLDQTIVSTAIVKIANDLKGFNLQAWATTAYLITSTIATPIYGKLSDIYGRKPFYLIAISIFVVGSIASTFSQSMYELAAFRAFQGIGAGGLMSLAMTIIGDIVPPRERAKYQGYILAVFGTSTVIGPILGGFFSGFDMLGGIAGWRWVFLINVPIGAIALFVVWKVLNVPHTRQEQKIDWWGALTLIIAVVPLLIVAEQGNTWGWGAGGSIACYAVGVFGIIMFIVVEKLMKDAALIPLRLFKNTTFSVAIVGGVIVGVAMFGAITMIPQFLQVVKGYSPTESGLLMLPLMGGLMLSSIVCGQITSRTGRYKWLPVIGTLIIAVGAFLYAQIHYDTPVWQPLVFAGIIGLGLGSCMQTLVIAVQNAGPRSDMGVSTAAATFFRQIGGTAGVAVFLTILFNVLPGNITKAFHGNIPAGAGGQIAGLSTNTSIIQGLPAAIKVPVLTGFTESITTVFYCAAGVALLAAIVLLFLKEIPLASGSGSAASTMEGGESLLNDIEDEAASGTIDNELYANSALEEPREPLLVGAGAGKHSLTNGHGEYQPATNGLAAPIMNSAAGSGIDTTIGTGGQPVTGHVRRQDGTSVSGAALTLIDQRGRQVSRATGNPDGSYSVATPGNGTYVLIVSAGGHQPQASSVVVGGGPAKLDITLTGSGELTGLVKIAGAGTPVANATVTLTDDRGEVNGAYITHADGIYTFHGVGAGHYTLVASGQQYRPVAVTLTVPDSGILRHDVELTGAVLLAGTARTEDDRLVPDARITVLDANGNVAAVARTDAEGRYVVSDLLEGDYTVVASGYPPATSQVNLLGGVEASHDVKLGYDQAFDELVDRS
ncbi:MAG: transporter [Amycolatopsis sp.]|jgi:EmrB/QacA subfamily drug resistance transporter|uniref:MFS transporter n=1 Tax=Amycolatopsis sp. TaxID=37632 RepID=UPI002626157D|nr:MFS transporter [Amycolatopsis sp.]MCU1681648.1 transporter [Amycolatopsis sp.]